MTHDVYEVDMTFKCDLSSLRSPCFSYYHLSCSRRHLWIERVGAKRWRFQPLSDVSMIIWIMILDTCRDFWGVNCFWHFIYLFWDSLKVYLMFAGAGWRPSQRLCLLTISPTCRSCSSLCSSAPWCSSWSTERSTTGMNGSRVAWRFSASGASAASLEQHGVWSSWTLDPCRTLFTSSSVSSTLYKVSTCDVHLQNK